MSFSRATFFIILNYNDNNSLELEHNKYKSQWWWALSSELINYRTLLSFNISDQTTQFFLNNPDYILTNILLILWKKILKTIC